MPELFKEILPSILHTKKNVFEDDNSYKDYSSFVVNRALSFHKDCVLYANELNKCSELSADQEYQYLLHTIRGMKRKFQPWVKADKMKDLDCVKTFFGYSSQKAIDAMKLLSDEQIDEIRELTNLGGVKK